MKLSTQILIAFLVAISIDLLDSFVNYTLTLKVKTNTEFLTNSEAIIRNSSNLNKDILDMQGAFRGYLLTEDEQFLLPYYKDLSTFPQLVNQQRQIITSPIQRSRLDSIVLFHNLWINYANEIIAAKKQSARDVNMKKRYQYLFETQFRQQLGKSYNDRITIYFDSFNQYEYKVREDRRAMLARSIRRTETSSLIFSLVMIIVSSGIGFYLVSRISKRIRSLVFLAGEISHGNFTSIEDNKRDELNGLSVSLNHMSARLSQNINQLTKKNDELNQFAYVVSHDLKAPIRGISNVMHWIEEDLDSELSPNMRKYLSIIPERINRMESLIDGLLHYARVGSDRPIKEDVDVGRMVDEIAELLMPATFDLTLENLPCFRTEKLLLEQVFSNLVSNAVRYTPGEGGRITVSCRDKGPLFYEFSVQDNGPGIAPEYHEKIFVIFQTLRERHDKESTGIGLTIVKKIVEDKHGTIMVKSAEGKGACFIFTWPKN